VLGVLLSAIREDRLSRLDRLGRLDGLGRLLHTGRLPHVSRGTIAPCKYLRIYLSRQKSSQSIFPPSKVPQLTTCANAQLQRNLSLSLFDSAVRIPQPTGIKSSNRQQGKAKRNRVQSTAAKARKVIDFPRHPSKKVVDLTPAGRDVMPLADRNDMGDSSRLPTNAHLHLAYVGPARTLSDRCGAGRSVYCTL
jgi:hypothetical protein